MDEFSGRVAQFQSGTEDSGYGQTKKTLRVWDFVIEHRNDAGDVDRSVSVQMVARAFDGTIRNDDDVKIELPGNWREGTTARVDHIWVGPPRNIWVKGTGGTTPSPVRTLACLGLFFVIAGLLLVGFAFAARHLFSVSQGFGTPPEVPGFGTPAPTNATVPNVTGLDNVGAAQALSNAGFKWTSQGEHSSTVPFGHVIRTDPPAGSTAPKGSTVTMFVSIGP